MIQYHKVNIARSLPKLEWIEKFNRAQHDLMKGEINMGNIKVQWHEITLWYMIPLFMILRLLQKIKHKFVSYISPMGTGCDDCNFPTKFFQCTHFMNMKVRVIPYVTFANMELNYWFKVDLHIIILSLTGLVTHSYRYSTDRILWSIRLIHDESHIILWIWLKF